MPTPLSANSQRVSSSLIESPSTSTTGRRSSTRWTSSPTSPGSSSKPATLANDQLVREFADLVSGLPPINGFSIDVTPISMRDLGQWRIDAIDVPEALAALRAPDLVCEGVGVVM